MTKGYVSLILHSHLPYVRHPEINEAMEERWLFEAINECYIPIIDVYDRLLDDGIKFKVTMSITPPLMAMLEDEYLNERYMKYLHKSIELAKKELERTAEDKSLNEVSKFYVDRFEGLKKTYEKYDRRLMNAFRKFDKLGVLEVITCSATHGLLPLLAVNPETVKAQLAIGVEYYKEVMGHAPKGIWLPECAYTYSLDPILKELGIQFFIAESTSIANASPRPKYSTAAPIATQNGVAAFGRDVEAGHQVWSSFLGYPGDANYREFYRDIGYELPMDYIKDYVVPSGIRIDTGIKYYKITGNTENKEYYVRENALERVKTHASHFAHSRNEQIKGLSYHMDKPPIITCPYDTELYGHWWFEGPDFLDGFIRNAADSWTEFELTTPKEYIEMYPVTQCASPSPASWGENGNFSVWLNGGNDWIYKELHEAAESMIRLANSFDEPNELEKRALAQAARELVLAESSDWPFIIKHNTTVQYAVKRVNTHLERFKELYNCLTKNRLEEKFIKEMEDIDNIFPNIDYTLYRNN